MIGWLGMGPLGTVLCLAIAVWLAWKCVEPFLVERNVRQGSVPASVGARHLLTTAVILIVPWPCAVLLLHLHHPLVWPVSGGLLLAGFLTLWKALAIGIRARRTSAAGKGAPPASASAAADGRKEGTPGGVASTKPEPR
jgi:hypothetical protein